jgi:hypothetical protein
VSAESFFRQGWARFPCDPTLLEWLRFATPAACAAASDRALRDLWLRYQGTWFAGVNVLGNDASGAVAGSGPLRGLAVDFIAQTLGFDAVEWDAGQVSVVYPGYPKPSGTEPESAYRFRLNRDAAHVDGLIAEGPEKRRMIREPHGFVLGIPMTQTGQGASPMVVWDGSHEVMRSAFSKVLQGPPAAWSNIDVTEAYQTARRLCFDTCRRVEIHAQPGEAYVIHRLALHGVAPWRDGAQAPDAGRVIAYFRPEAGNIQDWLTAP